MKSIIFRIGASQADRDTRTGVLLVLALVIGSMIVGVVMHYFWQHYAVQEKGQSYQTRYLSLGQHSTVINGGSVVMKVSVEYVGQETEKALNRALPRLNGEVLRRVSLIQMADLPRLRTPEGKQELADDLLETTRQALDAGQLTNNVKNILFEKFLIDS